jgi:hypothetical protein
VPTNAPYVLGRDLNRSESGCRRSSLALPTQPSINDTADALKRTQPSIMASRERGERVKARSRVVTFRMDQGTWDFSGVKLQMVMMKPPNSVHARHSVQINAPVSVTLI